MKRLFPVLGLALLFAVGVAIPYSVSALQKDAPEKGKKGGPRPLEIVCHCPFEIWGEEEPGGNEYWLCLNCRDFYFTSETLPDGTAGVDCGSATAPECEGCLAIDMFRDKKGKGKKGDGKSEADQAAAKPSAKPEKAADAKVKPVKSVKAKKKKNDKIKFTAGGKILHETTVRFMGQNREIDAKLFLVELPKTSKHGPLVVAHGWEIEKTGDPDNVPSRVDQDGTLYHVTVGNVTYPVLTVP